MEYIDLTHVLKDKIPVFPGDPKFELKDISNESDNYSIFRLNAGLHSGTHIDSPYHYLEDGKKIHELKLNKLIGKSNILVKNHYTDSNKKITTNDINDYLDSDKKIKIDDIKIPNSLEKIIILNTGSFNNWDDDNYFTDNFYLSKEITKLLIENEIFGIAIDTSSVDKHGKNKIHKLLLKNDIWIVENLTNLNSLTKDIYQSFFIPMNIKAEASFVRAFVEK
jgi:kynurenine formamidase